MSKRFLRLFARRRVPVHLQGEAAECGLACLAMVASFHGRETSVGELRRAHPVSIKGATLGRLVEVARAIGLRGQAVRVELDDLRRIRAPAVLHWNFNHFVVLTGVAGGRVLINDPQIGETALTWEEASRRFTGVALELSPTADFARKASQEAPSLRALTGPVEGLPGALSYVLLLSLLAQAVLLAAPFHLQWTVDAALLSGDTGLVFVLGSGFLVLVVLQVLIGAARSWAASRIATALGTVWQANVFAHMLRLPVAYFERRSVGDVVSRAGSVQSIQRVLSTSFVEAMIDGLMAIVALAVMLAYSVSLFALSAAAALLYVAVRSVAFSKLRHASQQQVVTGAKQQAHFLESIRGIQSIRVAGAEGKRYATWTRLLGNTMERDLQVARLRLVFSAASQAIFGVERVAVIWMGSYVVLEGGLSVGMLMAYIAYREIFSSRMSALVDRIVEFRMLRVHRERLADIVLSEPVRESGADLPDPGRPPGIRLDNVSFRYAEGEPWVLRHCNLTVPAGESIAICGPSGAGKSTLIKLMLGLLEPTEGEVLINGRSLASIAPLQLYRRAGIVLQDDQLFAGSLQDNVALLADSGDVLAVEEACRLAGIHDEIIRMPMGYQTLVGDMGSSLSGGQKQRVLLARALCKKPSILFLDEATSHLDLDKERLINQSVRALQVTKVIVAHRAETIASADHVVELIDGALRSRTDPPETPIALRPGIRTMADPA